MRKYFANCKLFRNFAVSKKVEKTRRATPKYLRLTSDLTLTDKLGVGTRKGPL